MRAQRAAFRTPNIATIDISTIIIAREIRRQSESHIGQYHQRDHRESDFIRAQAIEIENGIVNTTRRINIQTNDPATEI